MSATDARSGCGSCCGLMECAQAVLWLERLGHYRFGGMRCLFNWPLLIIAKWYRSIAPRHRGRHESRRLLLANVRFRPAAAC